MIDTLALVLDTVKPLNTADLGTGEKAAVFRKRRYWESYITYKKSIPDLKMGGHSEFFAKNSISVKYCQILSNTEIRAYLRDEAAPNGILWYEHWNYLNACVYQFSAQTVGTESIYRTSKNKLKYCQILSKYCFLQKIHCVTPTEKMCLTRLALTR